jgi:Domain of Unknown Function with PDB structure (DUF3857)
LLFAAVGLSSRAQDPSGAAASQAQRAKPEATPSPTAAAETPAQIELLETKIRFENNGDSRKEVHTRVRINSELGARQFAHLNFNFNRAYEKVEIPLVHISHESGGSADILPSAITDEPDPAVGDTLAYQDIRIKSVRILGLEPSDVLEYRVITTTTHPPFAPDFWLDHNFDRTGVVTKEAFDLDLPARRFMMPLDEKDPLPTPVDPNSAISPTSVGQIRISTQTPEMSKNQPNTDPDARLVYRWEIVSATLPKIDANVHAASDEPDIVVTTFASWEQLHRRLKFATQTGASTAIFTQAAQAMRNSPNNSMGNDAGYYYLVSGKVRTVDLPLDFGRFGKRKMEDVLSSSAGTPEDKISLYRALRGGQVHILAVAASDTPEKLLPRPSLFTQLVTAIDDGKRTVYADPSLEVAPLGMIRPDLRGKKALDLSASCSQASCWKTITGELPFSSTQRVSVDATITPEGALNAKVKYSMRGDNELLLRLAFHQSPRDKWKEVAQLMSLSDGFRGKIVSVSASDPLATKLPFTVEYEVSQPKFVDWSKKPVRISAPLPVLSVPDLPGKVAESNKASTIDLGTPLDVETRVTLHLPPHTGVELPTGTIVDRDYATFVSRYNTDSGTVTAVRHINFIHRQVGADRVPDYAAFLHAVQTDQAQLFTLTRADGSSTTAASTQQKP